MIVRVPIVVMLDPIVLKLGGSLYDHPRLGPGLKRFLSAFHAQRVLLVPGGGDWAETVRTADRIHHLGEDVCHRLAIRAMGLAGAMLREMLSPLAPAHEVADVEAIGVLESGLPASWDVTSDSIAAWVAKRVNASRLILLKSKTIRTDWVDAANHGDVDRYFPEAIRNARYTIEVRNFRSWLDDLDTIPLPNPSELR